MLGGLIEDKYTENNSKVPLLGDIPYLGALFRSESRTRNKTNLMVFLRPVVMRDAASANKLSLDRYDLMRAQQKDAQPAKSFLVPINESPVLPPVRAVQETPPPAPAPAPAPLSAAAELARDPNPDRPETAGQRPGQLRPTNMGARHPLPYAYAKAHTLLLEDDGRQLVLWAPESISLPALSEVLRLYEVDALEREAAPRSSTASPRCTRAANRAPRS